MTLWHCWQYMMNRESKVMELMKVICQSGGDTEQHEQLLRCLRSDVKSFWILNLSFAIVFSYYLIIDNKIQNSNWLFIFSPLCIQITWRLAFISARNSTLQTKLLSLGLKGNILGVVASKNWNGIFWRPTCHTPL